MKLIAALLGLCLILYVVLEAFETLVLPRRIERRFRFARAFYRRLWQAWTATARRIPSDRRDDFLAVFGPLSLLLLLSFWAEALVAGFAIVGWGTNAAIHGPDAHATFGTYLYLSATTFITLGFGDVVPRSAWARLIADVESGLGFGFLAIVIGYLPVLYQAFSRREVDIALLDARASSPPSAGALLSRIGACPENGDLNEMLKGYERWSAELLESHLSFPILMYYRSQHDRQSWLSALTAMLDTCAFLIAYTPPGKTNFQARMTFAMSRHAAIDLALVFDSPPTPPDPTRLNNDDAAYLKTLLKNAGLQFVDTPEADARLTELRGLYDPYVNSLSHILLLALPSWLPNPDLPDNWQTSAWHGSENPLYSGPKIKGAFPLLHYSSRARACSSNPVTYPAPNKTGAVLTCWRLCSRR